MDNLKEEDVEVVENDRIAKKEHEIWLQERQIDMRNQKACATMQEAEIVRQATHFDNQLKYDKMECARRNLECLCKVMNTVSSKGEEVLDTKDIKEIAKSNLEILGTIK